MKIAICDDSTQDKHCLFNYISSYCETGFIHASIAEYSSGDALLKNFTPNQFDMIFLDIYMDGLSGIDTAKRIRQIDNECALIFVTSSSEHALDGFAVNALHYLVKPVDAEKIAEVFNRCNNMLNALHQYIEVVSDRLLVKILVKTITYVEVYDKACFIHKDGGVIKTYQPLEEVAKQLDGKGFLRCHRSYIVNMRSVANVEDNDFVLQSGDRIPIRRSEKQAIKQIYMDFLFSLTREENDVC